MTLNLTSQQSGRKSAGGVSTSSTQRGKLTWNDILNVLQSSP